MPQRKHSPKRFPEEEIARVLLPEQTVQSVTVESDYVIAVGRHGLIWILSADDLSILRVIEPRDGPFLARNLLAREDTLYITRYDNNDEMGTIVVVDGWKPGDQNQTGQSAGTNVCRKQCNEKHESCTAKAQRNYKRTGEKATARDAGEDCRTRQLECFRNC